MMLKVALLVCVVGVSLASPARLEKLLRYLKHNKQTCEVNPRGPAASEVGDAAVLEAGSCGAKYGRKENMLKALIKLLESGESEESSEESSRKSVSKSLSKSLESEESVESSESSASGLKTLQKILGGENARLNEWPWMVSVQDKGTGRGTNLHRCGGSMIHNQWVLTSAKCLFPGGITDTFDACSIQVEVAEQSLSTRDDRGHTASVSDVIVHPDFDATTGLNDLALIKLEEAEDLEKYGWLGKICLEADDSDVIGKEGYVTGWGSKVSSSPDKTERFLQEGEVVVINADQCGGATIAQGQLCAGDLGKRAVCQKDIGGPLMVEENGKWMQVGIVSEADCDESGFGVYTRVSHYHGWISAAISEN